VKFQSVFAKYEGDLGTACTLLGEVFERFITDEMIKSSEAVLKGVEENQYEGVDKDILKKMHKDAMEIIDYQKRTSKFLELVIKERGADGNDNTED